MIYSWENNDFLENEWAMALCNELSSYKRIETTCDMFWDSANKLKNSSIEKFYTKRKTINFIRINSNKG